MTSSVIECCTIIIFGYTDIVTEKDYIDACNENYLPEDEPQTENTVYEMDGGVGDNKFSPVSDYTREQSIVMIMRLFDLVK